MIQTLIDWLSNVIETLGYPGVALAVFLESFFTPIPSELILPFSGFVASTGALNIYIVILVATVAAYLGSLPFYFLGFWGEKFMFRFLDRWGRYLFIEKRDVDNVFKLFTKHGNKLVFFGRVIPVVRSLISFPAGVVKMNFLLFTIYTLLGSLVWNVFLAYAGFLMGSNWGEIGEYVGKYEKVIIGLGIIVVVLYIGRGIYRNFILKSSDQ